ncbi:MAG: polysaccharide export protein [Desulfobulbaceae bacterium]|nr:polysaccharide export protein [Desulfobulbaceae bacterium]
MGNVNKNKILHFFVSLAVVVATVWPVGVKADPAAEAEKDYLIGVGDVLEVQVWQEPDLSRTVKVRLDGKISLPLAGDVQAAGKTTGELDQFLEKKIADLVTEPAVSVMLVENRSRRYYVVGQVGQPGEFPIEFPLTILQAIARSGGFQEWAKREEIKVVRRQGGKDEFLNFDYDEFTKGKNLQQNVLIAPGDTIIVP